MYTTPCLGYAAFPVYAPLLMVAPHQWIQTVVQLRVRPGSYTACPGTLGGKYWPKDLLFDPDFPSLEGMEWILESPLDVVPVGVLVRELGSDADPQVFGDFAPRVTSGPEGPEFELSRLLEEQYRESGFFRFRGG